MRTGILTIALLLLAFPARGQAVDAIQGTLDRAAEQQLQQQAEQPHADWKQPHCEICRLGRCQEVKCYGVNDPEDARRFWETQERRGRE